VIAVNQITQQAIRRGTFRSVKELIAKIDAFVRSSNAHATPFVWTATADSIFAKLQRLCESISGTATLARIKTAQAEACAPKTDWQYDATRNVRFAMIRKVNQTKNPIQPAFARTAD